MTLPFTNWWEYAARRRVTKVSIWTKEIREMQSNALADQIDSGNPYPIKLSFQQVLIYNFSPTPIGWWRV